MEPGLRNARGRTRRIAAGTILGLALAPGCASDAADSDAGKVWMRDGGQVGLQSDLDHCRAAASMESDVRLCMMSNGWRLESPQP